MTRHNRIRKTAAKLAAAVLTVALAVQAVMPVTEVQAATYTQNRALEIPVCFQTDCILDEWQQGSTGTPALTMTNSACGTDLEYPCSGDDFTSDSLLSYTAYIPSDYFSGADSAILLRMDVSAYDAEAGEYTQGSVGIEIAVSADGAYGNEDTSKYPDLEIGYEKRGDFYVVTVTANIWIDKEKDLAGTEVLLRPDVMIYGFSMDVPNGDIYLDDLVLTSESDTTCFSENFESRGDSVQLYTSVRGGTGKFTNTETLNVVDPTCDNTETTNDDAETTNNNTESTNDDTDTTYGEAESTYDDEPLTILKKKISVKKGKKKNLSSYISVGSASEVTYKSSNKKVATVNSKGVVKGKKKGTATITVTANGVKKKIKVTVK